jgi:ABC-type sugar transport system ATPase subunit
LPGTAGYSGGIFLKNAPLLEMKKISKRFPGVNALDGVDFELYPGEVHALLGENGAGKSTLIKILGGIYSKDAGEILINGEIVNIGDVNQARDLGINVIHQELVLVPYLSATENIFLGREPKTKIGFTDFEQMNREAARMFNNFNLDINPKKLIAELSIAQQQMVEIVKSVSFSAKIIIMDEPTSSIANKEVEALFLNIRQLKEQGIAIIYISHRMSELKEVADRVTILRDGKYVATKRVSETSNDELISLMVGRPITNYYTRTYNACSEVVLNVEKINTGRIHDVSFELKKGEILGFSGLIGAGRTETVLALLGIDRVLSGKIFLEGREVAPGESVGAHIRWGIALVPENRRTEGLFPYQSVSFNLTLKVLFRFIRGIVSDRAKERNIVEDGLRKLSIRAANETMPVGLLSGGNQQKTIFASWIAADPKVLILDEPTRGIDVGAKSEIYAIMNDLAKSGVGIIMISSELPEIINMSDRVAVMREGRIQTILERNDINQEKIMQYAVML